MTAFVLNDDTGLTLTGGSPSSDSPKFACGKIVMSATSLTATEYLAIDVGFTPKYFRFMNLTDVIMLEWHEGMTEDTCFKTTGSTGAVTYETTNKGISIVDALDEDNGVTNSSGRTVLVSQNATLAAVTASDTHLWMAMG